jgi:hypothetical protein
VKISKQVKWQKDRVARGLCRQCGKKAFLGGQFCLDCKLKDKPLKEAGKYLRLRNIWPTVDWSKSNAAIGRELGVSSVAVWFQRKRRIKK